ncbi:MAG TPA: T9SS type A sorting domain-containing protein, partial [Bacteroidetes bacterium]|nr:T9SS type A sorting domain-containing protein [Bacteroidota bacterium]
ETFQVILLDPAYYTTATGDGRIIFQYKDMSTTAINSEGTVGIENHTQTDGLQYFFDGAYDVHTHHLENEFAILFSTPLEAPELEVTLTPYGAPIQIPATGGSFDYNIEVANNGTSPTVCDIWCDATLPSGSHYLTLGPVNLTLPGGFLGDRDRTQAVPAAAPAGNYTYNAYLGNYPSVIFAQDSFPFEKLTTGQGASVTEWANTGESFDDWFTSVPETVIPGEYSLGQNYPNPFNPTTTISFALPEASHVKLTVFDLQGRVVSELVNGTRDAGVHEVTLDAGDLSSGLYFYRINAGDFSSVRKMVLVK